MRWLVFIFLLTLSYDAKAITAGDPKELSSALLIGQRWSCGVEDPVGSGAELIALTITGIATKRAVSKRPNFQSDEVVVSVDLIDVLGITERRYDRLTNGRCDRSLRFNHVAFTASALQKCDLKFVSNHKIDADKFAARMRWLQRMSRDEGVVVELHPGEFLQLVRRKRCQ
ncbi:MAG: hypothetical protein AAF557_02575 [Pseudomonadota bacterium]